MFPGGPIHLKQQAVSQPGSEDRVHPDLPALPQACREPRRRVAIADGTQAGAGLHFMVQG
jgi:hypothetical protein